MSDISAPWMVEAKAMIGTKEIQGLIHEPKIVSWWARIFRRGIKSDETPWCAAFVGAMLEGVGVQSTRFESARSYATWGVSLTRPVYGAIVVMERKGGGHVGFCAGTDGAQNIAVLGGNQNNEVNISTFPMSRITAWRWPREVPIPGHGALPIYARAKQSTSEA